MNGQTRLDPQGSAERPMSKRRLARLKAHESSSLGSSRTPEAPNCQWKCDCTYIQSSEGGMCMVIVLDRFSGTVVGWSMKSIADSGIPAQAIQMRTAWANTPAGRFFISPKNEQSRNAIDATCAEAQTDLVERFKTSNESEQTA